VFEVLSGLVSVLSSIYGSQTISVYLIFTATKNKKYVDVSLVFPLKLKFGQLLDASGDCSSFHLLKKLTCETYLTLHWCKSRDQCTCDAEQLLASLWAFNWSFFGSIRISCHPVTHLAQDRRILLTCIEPPELVAW